MKKAVMYGAGNIGRGFIGQLFSQSGYAVVFLDINAAVIDALNRDRRYPVRIVSDHGYNDIPVENVRGVNVADVELAAGEIASVDIMATAVGVHALPRIGGVIAKGLQRRWNSGNFAPFNIIICENLLDADHYLEKLIKQALSAEEWGCFDTCVGLVEASIGRMVPVMTPEMQDGNPLRVCVEAYDELPVDKDAFRGEIPRIVNMVPFSPFGFYIRRKLFMHNMSHAAAAYLGYLNGYKYIWEACGNPAIKLLVLRALQESALAMAEEYRGPLPVLLEHGDDLLYRFGNKLLGDTIARVGRDPVRKLSADDRLAGAARLCRRHGIEPVYICMGIAAGFLFAPEEDEAALAVQEMINSRGIEAAIGQICGIAGEDTLSAMIVEFFNLWKKGYGPDGILQKAEEMKNGMGRKHAGSPL